MVKFTCISNERKQFFLFFFYFKCFVSLLCTTKPLLMAYSMEYGVLSMVLFFSFFLLTFMFFLPGSLLTGGHLPSAVCHLFMEKPCQLVWDLFRVFPILGNVSYRFFTSFVTISWCPVDKVWSRNLKRKIYRCCTE